METNKIVPRKLRRPSRVVGLLLPLTIIALIWLFRDPIRRRIIESGTLANDAPPLENVEEVIQNASDPRFALLAAWNSGKIVHREVAIHNFSRVFPDSGPLPPQFESILLSAALDPDLDVREAALNLLHSRNHPALAALAAEQLRDVDQAVRLLGLYQLKFVDRTVKARGVNYPILLDEHNEVGGRYNGGELPTTVIVDATGNIRRRFIGARSLPVFEAMLAEIISSKL